MLRIAKFYTLLVTLSLLANLTAAQVVDIPDRNFERLIRAELDIPRGTPVLREDMQRLTHILWLNENIVDLTGLEHATNLVLAILHGNPIGDLSPLGRLPNLEIFHMIPDPNIMSPPINNIDALANATALRDLVLIDVGLKDISALAGLTNLVSLDLANNRIVDIGPLANLTALEKLHIERNEIVDVSPLAGLIELKELHIHFNPCTDLTPIWNLAIADFRYDEECAVPALPIYDRISERVMPSVGTLWAGETITKNPMSDLERLALLDLHAAPLFIHIDFKKTPGGYQLGGDVEAQAAVVEERRSMNPNTILLANIRQRDAHVGASWSVFERLQYTEDWEYWLRDENGNVVRNRGITDTYLIDFRRPEVQDMIVEQVIAVAQCGLYDGIYFDWWSETGGTLVDYAPPGDPSPNIAYSMPAEETQARLNILRRIRANVRDDFIIVGNANRRQLPTFAPYQNGNWMELRYDRGTIGYTREGIIEIETNLLWLERNMREPRMNLLQAIGIYTEPGYSPRNLQNMRLFTTMSLTCSDGYIMYTSGATYSLDQGDLHHYWYDFWDADLGQPVGTIATPYKDTEGVYIREFTNGWAVYNRSGSAHVVELPESTQSVRSGLEAISHAVPDLDGDIFIRFEKPNPADVNKDGTVNILDLVIVAQSLGTGENDVNGDGVTNVFDLVIIANAINQ